MAKFKYKMANILDIKFKMEEQARSAFAEANYALKLEEDKLAVLIGRLEEYREQGKSLREEVLHIDEIRDNARAIENMQYQIEEQKKNVELAEEVVEQAKVKLNRAMQDRKIHEKLRENAFEEFRQEVNSAESKEVDELVSYRFGNGKD